VDSPILDKSNDQSFGDSNTPNPSVLNDRRHSSATKAEAEAAIMLSRFIEECLAKIAAKWLPVTNLDTGDEETAVQGEVERERTSRSQIPLR